MKTKKLNNLFFVVTLLTQISCTSNNVLEPFPTKNVVNSRQAIPRIEDINVGYEHNRLLNMYAFCIMRDSSSIDTITDLLEIIRTVTCNYLHDEWEYNNYEQVYYYTSMTSSDSIKNYIDRAHNQLLQDTSIYSWASISYKTFIDSTTAWINDSCISINEMRWKIMNLSTHFDIIMQLCNNHDEQALISFMSSTMCASVDYWNDNNLDTWNTISYLPKKKDKDKDKDKDKENKENNKDKETKELKKKVVKLVQTDMTGAFMGATHGGVHGAIAIGAIMSGLEALQWD